MAPTKISKKKKKKRWCLQLQHGREQEDGSHWREHKDGSREGEKDGACRLSKADGVHEDAPASFRPQSAPQPAPALRLTLYS